MADPEYYKFIKLVKGEIPDTLSKEEETSATPQEIGWWKQQQIRRAIHHARYSTATPVEIHLLRTHDILVSPHARRRTKKFER